jgi:hypothetical protein
MHSRALAYVLIAAVWIAFAAVVTLVQSRAQKRLEQRGHEDPGEPGEPGEQGLRAAD